MAPEMGCKTAIVWLFLLGAVTANVELTGEWKQNFGWEVICSWRTLVNDTLQSVRLYRNGNQYAIFRPEKDGYKAPFVQASNRFRMEINCQSDLEGQSGSCATLVQLLQPPFAIDLYKCEVSGERPTFRLETKEYEAVVPSSKLELVPVSTSGSSERLILNCSAAGIPPPRLAWTVGGQKIPADFSNVTWNVVTKLWHSWSTLNPQSVGPDITCYELITKRDQLLTGKAVTYSAAMVFDGNITIVIASLVSIALQMLL